MVRMRTTPDRTADRRSLRRRRDHYFRPGCWSGFRRSSGAAQCGRLSMTRMHDARKCMQLAAQPAGWIGSGGVCLWPLQWQRRCGACMCSTGRGMHDEAAHHHPLAACSSSRRWMINRCMNRRAISFLPVTVRVSSLP
jgi:hypothetical protein